MTQINIGSVYLWCLWNKEFKSIVVASDKMLFFPAFESGLGWFWFSSLGGGPSSVPGRSLMVVVILSLSSDTDDLSLLKLQKACPPRLTSMLTWFLVLPRLRRMQSLFACCCCAACVFSRCAPVWRI